MDKTAPLVEELKFFREHRDEWLEHYAGQHAVIKGSELLGTFSTFQQAFEAGVAKFGNTPFLVKKIEAKEMPALSPALVLGLISANTQL